MAIFSRLSRFFRPSRTSHPPSRPKRLAPPADSQLNGQYPSHEEMLRSMYESAVARDAAYPGSQKCSDHHPDHKTLDCHSKSQLDSGLKLSYSMMAGVPTVEIQYWGHLVWEKDSPENMAENITAEPRHSESPGSLC